MPASLAETMSVQFSVTLPPGGEVDSNRDGTQHLALALDTCDRILISTHVEAKS